MTDIEQILISVIIPVYNMEKHLSATIESVLNQTYKNLELILVDDCSTDKSGIICDEYSGKDDRVKVIHHVNNKGLSMSREDGLDISSGSWISFLDNDDLLSPYAFQKMLMFIDGAEMVCVNSTSATDEEMEAPIWKNEEVNSQEITGKEYSEVVYCSVVSRFGIAGPLWGKIIKKDALTRVLSYMQQYKNEYSWVFFEDAMMGPFLYYQVKKVVYIANTMHLYRSNGLSSSMRPGPYYYQGARAKEIHFEYFKNKWSKEAYEGYLIGSFMFISTVWFRCWKNETDTDKKAEFEKYTEELFARYQKTLSRIRVRDAKSFVNKSSVMLWGKNRELWGWFIGKFYFKEPSV